MTGWLIGEMPGPWRQGFESRYSQELRDWVRVRVNHVFNFDQVLSIASPHMSGDLETDSDGYSAEFTTTRHNIHLYI